MPREGVVLLKRDFALNKMGPKTQSYVPMVGVEPTSPYGHTILSRACLPPLHTGDLFSLECHGNIYIMLSANELRNGTVFSYEDGPWKVTKFEHSFKGRGRGKVMVKARNLKPERSGKFLTKVRNGRRRTSSAANWFIFTDP